MPDADIPPIVLSDEEIAEIQAAMPRLSSEWRTILQNLGLDYAQIETLLDAQFEYRGKIAILDTIEKVIDDAKKAKFIANWNVNIFIPLLREEGFNPTDIDYPALELDIYDLLEQNKLSSTSAKALFRELASVEILPDVEKFAIEKGYIQNSNEDEISAIIDDVLNDIASAKAVEDLKNGNEKVIGFLVGQVMRKSAGKANPALVQKIIKEKLS